MNGVFNSIRLQNDLVQHCSTVFLSHNVPRVMEEDHWHVQEEKIQTDIYWWASQLGVLAVGKMVYLVFMSTYQLIRTGSRHILKPGYPPQQYLSLQLPMQQSTAVISRYESSCLKTELWDHLNNSQNFMPQVGQTTPWSQLLKVICCM